MNNIIKSIVSILLITMLLFVSGASALAQGDDNLCVRDINGDMVRTGERYYIVEKGEEHRALSYKKDWFWDYIYVAENNDRSKIVGIPVEFYNENNFGISGLPILPQNKVFIKMNNEFFNFNGGAFSWIWLDDKEDSVKLVQSDGQNSVAIATGNISTVYYDRYGRICDKWQADTSRTEGVFMETTHVGPLGKKHYDDRWTATYIHSNPPQYYFIPAN